ncbi:zinc finger protein 37-like [Armigeres subalbatus]|uniref:zinc finger protein 37-like n=1 Tax=Armigeres subalbatus TaxID=124917 RepID=UPI002ED31452
MDSVCCRLCGYNSPDLIDIFDEQGTNAEYARKIGRYLYLLVTLHDDLSKSICWMCSQQLDSFHRFHEKINEIQQRLLQDRYLEYVIEAHHVEGEIEIVETIEDVEMEKEDFPLESDTSVRHQEETVEVQVIESQSQLENEKHEVDNELTVHLIPDVDQEDSFLVVKSEAETNVPKQAVLEQPPLFSVDSSISDVQIYEIRRKLDVSEDEIRTEEEDDIVLEEKMPLRRSRRARDEKSQSKKNAHSDIELTIEEENINRQNESPIRKSQSDVILVHLDREDEDLMPKRKTPLRKSRRVKESNLKKDVNPNTDLSLEKANVRQKKLRPIKKSQSGVISNHLDRECEEHSEGESGDDFPARDSDNEEWPAADSMEKFPTTLLRDGLLLVKGRLLMSMINQFYNLQCDMCNEKPVRFKTLSEMFSHYELSHGQAGYITCCQTKIHRYPGIIMHMARHIQPEAFKCDICGYMVTRPRFLSSHRQTHLPDDEKPFACEQCPKRFCWKRALQIHENSHKSPDERVVYVCPVCEKPYDTPGGLSSHKRKAHLTPSVAKVPHVCEICANNFATASGLKEHMNTIHQPREKGLLQCTECSKWLMNQRCLKIHMQLHRKEDFTCDSCDYRTKKASLLKRHNITRHQKERPFACDQCDKTFKHKRLLTVHKSTKHTENTPGFKCPFCDRSFKSSTNFYTHRKNRHPNELAAMKEQAEAEKKLQRIKAGIEPDDIPLAEESTITTAPDGTRIITINSRNSNLHDSMNGMIVLDITEGVIGVQSNK